MSLEQQVANLVASTSDLVSQVAGKVGQIDAKTREQVAAFQVWQNQFSLRAQQNLLRDSGRFFDPDLPVNADACRRIALTTDFAFAGSMLSLYNGATVVSAGKFIHDNSTNGGSGPALPERVKTLTDKMRGLGSSRHGVEYYLAEITMPNNPTTYSSIIADNVTRYLAQSNTLLVSDATHLAWVLAVSGSVVMGYASHRNGLPSDNPVVRPADGWVHLAGHSTFNGGYVMPGLYCEPGTKFILALPAVVPGNVTGLVHTSPILTHTY